MMTWVIDFLLESDFDGAKYYFSRFFVDWLPKPPSDATILLDKCYAHMIGASCWHG